MNQCPLVKQAAREHRAQVRSLISGLPAGTEQGEASKIVHALILLAICMVVGAAAWQFALGVGLR